MARDRLLAACEAIVGRRLLAAELEYAEASRSFDGIDGARLVAAQEALAAAEIDSTAVVSFGLAREATQIATALRRGPRTDVEAKRAAHALAVWPERLALRVAEVESRGSCGQEVALALGLARALLEAVESGAADGDDAARADRALQRVAFDAMSARNWTGDALAAE